MTVISTHNVAQTPHSTFALNSQVVMIHTRRYFYSSHHCWYDQQYTRRETRGFFLCNWGNFTEYMDRSVQYAHERTADQTRSHKSVVTSWNRIEPNFQIINTKVHVMRKHVELQTRRKWNAATSFWIGLMVLMCLLIIQYRNTARYLYTWEKVETQ